MGQVLPEGLDRGEREERVMLFFKMGNGKLIAAAHRGVSRKEIKALQKEEWARSQGGICGVINYTKPYAIYFAMKD